MALACLAMTGKDYDSDASSEGLRSAILRIRKVVDAAEDPAHSMIENVARVGYRLNSSS